MNLIGPVLCLKRHRYSSKLRLGNEYFTTKNSHWLLFTNRCFIRKKLLSRKLFERAHHYYVCNKKRGRLENVDERFNRWLSVASVHSMASRRRRPLSWRPARQSRHPLSPLGVCVTVSRSGVNRPSRAFVNVCTKSNTIVRTVFIKPLIRFSAWEDERGRWRRHGCHSSVGSEQHCRGC